MTESATLTNPNNRRVLLDTKGEYDFSLETEVVNWTHNPAFALASEDFSLRPEREVTSFVLHNTQGVWPQTIIEGAAPRGMRAENVLSMWRRDKRTASTPLVIDTDGSTVQAHYLVPVVAFHAKTANARSIGAELVMETPGKLYTASMETAARIIHGLIQSGHPQFKILNPPGMGQELPWLEIRTNYPTNGKKPPMVPVQQRGVFGHRDVRPMDRGRGDPGDAVMLRVAEVLESLCGRGPVRYRVVRT